MVILSSPHKRHELCDLRGALFCFGFYRLPMQHKWLKLLLFLLTFSTNCWILCSGFSWPSNLRTFGLNYKETGVPSANASGAKGVNYILPLIMFTYSNHKIKIVHSDFIKFGTDYGAMITRSCPNFKQMNLMLITVWI